MGKSRGRRRRVGHVHLRQCLCDRHGLVADQPRRREGLIPGHPGRGGRLHEGGCLLAPHHRRGLQVLDGQVAFPGDLLHLDREGDGRQEVAHGTVGNAQHRGYALVEGPFAQVTSLGAGLERHQLPHQRHVLRALGRGQVDALQVLYQLHAAPANVVALEDKGGYAPQSGLHGGTPAPLPRDDLIDALVVGRQDEERMQHAILADRPRKLGELRRIHGLAGLVGVGLQTVDEDMDQAQLVLALAAGRQHALKGRAHRCGLLLLLGLAW